MNYLSKTPASLFKDKKVLVRLDVNVPLTDSGEILATDTDRIVKSQATLDYLRDAGASVIILSHIGRDPKESLAPVAKYMNIPLVHLDDHESWKDIPLVMLENLRQSSGEESNDVYFAERLASLGDCYINDAFAVSHRNHASIVGIPKLLPSFAGFQLEQEIQQLQLAFQGEHPIVLIMGGAKFETKLPVIEHLLPHVDWVCIGGALANTFLYARGIDVGVSLIDKEAHLDTILDSPKILVPDDFERQETRIVDIIVPVAWQHVLKDARTIIWNGPMGNYENGFTKGTEQLVALLAETNAHTIIGGGDSIALIHQLGLSDRFSFLSTGGGAMLDYLAQGTLPGIQALE